MNHTPPSEFSSLGLIGRYTSVRGGREWHGPCPFCQGADRFRIHTDHTFPKWNWECRKCGQKGWADQLNPALREQIDPAKLEYLRQADLARQAQETEKRQRAMEKFTTQELWDELHRRMEHTHYEWWARQGIPRLWADFWKLGFIHDKVFEFEGEMHHRPAYTIPKFDLGWRPTNMDFRLLDPPVGAGKYRPLPNLPPAPFISRPDLPALTEEVFIVEGSKKAAVLAIQGAKDTQVLGLPSCTSWAGVEERVRVCERVWVIFDPDALDKGEKFCREVGPAARLVVLPVKPDDAFTKYGMTNAVFATYLKNARKIQEY